MRSRAPTATESVCLGRLCARAALASYTYCPMAARSKLTRRRCPPSGEARLGHAHHIHVVRARRTRHRGAQTFNSVARNPFNPVTPARADDARLELRRAIVYEWVEPQAPARVCPPLQNVSSPATKVVGEKLSGVRRMETKEKAEAERLKQDEEVKRALNQTGGQALKEEEARREEAKQPPQQAEKSHKFWAGTYLLLLIALGVLYYALQTPTTSLLGWISILVRAPYRVGDRIRIGNATGDVIDVSYLDTTLWEFGGEFLSTDHPSGRVIKFPNSGVLNQPVWNYSWPLFPYIWNEITFSVAYNSDLEFVSKIMREVAEEEIGEAMMERIRVYRELLAQTPVNELEVREYPSVIF